MLKKALADLLVGSATINQVLELCPGNHPDRRREAFLELCDEEGVASLLYHLLNDRNSKEEGFRQSLPKDIVSGLADRSRLDGHEELLRAASLRIVCGALNKAQVPFLLMKGTPLAYTLYPFPSLRARSDTDLLIRKQDRLLMRKALQEIGCVPSSSSSQDHVFSQEIEIHRDAFGEEHPYDVHWEMSNRRVFARLFQFDELLESSQLIPGVGVDARGLGNIHALALACLHPVMHHHNCERLIWIYDLKLLVESMSELELGQLVDLALSRGIGKIVHRGLLLAGDYLNVQVDLDVLRKLEQSSLDPAMEIFLTKKHRWYHEVLSDLESEDLRGRLGLLKEIAFPNAAYMLGKYGFGPNHPSWTRSWVLPALYLRRGIQGLWKVAAGRKK